MKNSTLPYAGLRVCHLAKYYAPAVGGIEAHVQVLARQQAAEGAEVEVVCVNHVDRQGRDVVRRPLAVTTWESQTDGPVRVTRVGRVACVARFDFCWSLRRYLAEKSRTCDVLHLHVPNPTMLIALAGNARNIPLVITQHSDVIRQRVLSALIRPLERVVYDRAQRILATSPLYQSRSRTLQHYADKVSVVPLGIELNSFTNPSEAALQAARQLRSQYGEPLWLCIGRMVYYKGMATAVDALPHVPGTLILVGSGPLEEQLRLQAQQLGVADRIVWKPHLSQDELIGAYHAATALWFPSNARSEAFGLVQVEAMACGCPVVNAAIEGSGVPWVSPHEETGLTVSPNNTAEFVAASQRLLNEPGLRARLAAGGRSRATQEFSHEIMAQRDLDVYSAVLQDRACRASDTTSVGLATPR